MDEGLIDKQKAIEELGIDEGVYDELLRCFISEAEAEIYKLEEAVKEDNFAEIAAIGHGLKGIAGNLRIKRMQDVAKVIEINARESKDKRMIMEKTEALKKDLWELRLWIK